MSATLNTSFEFPPLFPGDGTRRIVIHHVGYGGPDNFFGVLYEARWSKGWSGTSPARVSLETFRRFFGPVGDAAIYEANQRQNATRRS